MEACSDNPEPFRKSCEIIETEFQHLVKKIVEEITHALTKNNF